MVTGQRPRRTCLSSSPGRRLLGYACALGIGVGGAVPSLAATFFVRPDGGTASECTGRVDAPYPGSGHAQPCAFNHPFQALPPGGAPRIAGGDTLIIGSGAYMMGVGAPGADACVADAAWDCTMPAIPSGIDAEHPTRILGSGWESRCASPPVLWGTERAAFILDLTDTEHAEIACLELTDRSPCVTFHSGGLACEREQVPFGQWAGTGVYAVDSVGVTLRHLNIHGLAAAGVWAGRLTDWTVEDVRIAANGWVGWDGDVDGDDHNAGRMVFRRVRIEWNGCGETFPEGQPTGCWAQTAGGYGDGLGTGETGGDWLFEGCVISHNTSDGLDLLYLRPPSSVTIRNSRFERNAGNQVKTSGPAWIENTLVVGECAFFSGAAFTHHVDPCRAAGNAVSLSLWPGDEVTLRSSTITGHGDCLVLAGCEGTCTGQERATLRNNLLIGNEEWGGTDRTCLLYAEGFPHGEQVWDADYSLIWGVKHDPCPGAHDVCGTDPQVADIRLPSFDARLLATSPAIGRAQPSTSPAFDLDGFRRDEHPDIGAFEYRSGARQVRRLLRGKR